MNRHLSLLLAAALAVSALFTATPAQAQATRTWISGVGDDVNPCSRTAPCKTFQGAISKTAAGGEINCIDSGGFGAVTITKAMTIDCGEVHAGILVANQAAIIVNAGASDVVRIRGLDIFGFGGTFGVRFLNGAALQIDDCRIRGFNLSGGWGVQFIPAGTSELFISNSLVSENGLPSDPSDVGGGVFVQPQTAGVARVVLNNVDLVNNAQGLRADSTGSAAPNAIRVSVQDSTANQNSFAGFAAVAPGGFAVDMVLDGSAANYNGGAGVTANGLNARVRMSRTVSTGNNVGTLQSASGVVESLQNNLVYGNANDGTRVNINQN